MYDEITVTITAKVPRMDDTDQIACVTGVLTQALFDADIEIVRVTAERGKDG